MIEIKDFQLVKGQVRLATDWILGGYENAISDGAMKQYELPSCLDLVEEIYQELKCSHFSPGCQWVGALFAINDCDEVLLKSMIAYAVVNTRMEMGDCDA